MASVDQGKPSYKHTKEILNATPMKIVEHMPTKKKKKKAEKENWFWNGFVIGGFFGAIIYSVTSDYLNRNLALMALARILTLLAFLCGMFITVYNAYKRKALISPFADGFISGFVFAATAVDWYLHGIRFS